jgi:uncharacterized protein GlcG (DUF336 family)
MMITLEQAKTAIAAGEAHANKLGVPVNIAVLDAGTNLKAFSRMDGAVLGSMDVAMGKARTAALFQTTSEAVWEYCKPGAPAPGLARSNGGLMTFPGGIPVLAANGEMLGAVGVSGGAVSQDREIAEAAVGSVKA